MDIGLINAGELRRAIKGADTIYLWCKWQRDDGDYVAVSKALAYRLTGLNMPDDDGISVCRDSTPVQASLSCGGSILYIG